MSPRNIGVTGAVAYTYMVKDALIRTNPYLKDAAKRDAAFSITVSSSTAIEGVRLSEIGAPKRAGKRPRPTAVKYVCAPPQLNDDDLNTKER